jgi:flagellar biosynthetic protein FliQ
LPEGDVSVTDGLVMQIAQQGLWVMLELAGPILGLGLAVGLVVGILQATTQINDQTLSFLPKLAAMLLALLFFGAWMLQTLVDFTRHLLVSLPGWI